MTEGRQFKGPSFDNGQAGRVIASLAMAVMMDQVWLLAQFYSVDFSKSRVSVKKCVFNKRTIKVLRQLFSTVSWDLHT